MKSLQSLNLKYIDLNKFSNSVYNIKDQLHFCNNCMQLELFYEDKTQAEGWMPWVPYAEHPRHPALQRVRQWARIWGYTTRVLCLNQLIITSLAKGRRRGSCTPSVLTSAGTQGEGAGRAWTRNLIAFVELLRSRNGFDLYLCWGISWLFIKQFLFCFVSVPFSYLFKQGRNLSRVVKYFHQLFLLFKNICINLKRIQLIHP